MDGQMPRCNLKSMAKDWEDAGQSPHSGVQGEISRLAKRDQ